MQSEVVRALGSADARDRLATSLCEAFKGTSGQLATTVRDELLRWLRIVKESGTRSTEVQGAPSSVHS